MDGVLPMSFALTDASTRSIGQSVQQGLAPFLLGMSTRLTQFNRDLQTFVVMLGPLGLAIVASIERVRAMGIPVVVTNLDLLELLGIVGVALLLLNTLLLQEILVFVRRISCYMVAVMMRLDQLHLDLVGIGFELTALGSCVCALLQAILAKLNAGLALHGVITFVISLPGVGSLDDLILKFLELAGAAFLLALASGVLIPALLGLAVGFALLAGAVALLAKALGLMPSNLGDIVKYLGLLALGLILFGAVILAVASRGKQALQLIAGFLFIPLFLALLAGALRLMPTDKMPDILKGLGQLALGIFALGLALALLSPDKFKQVMLGLLGIAAFMLLLGLALKLFDAETLKAVPSLNQLFEGLIKLANAIKEFSPDDLKKIGLSFLGIAAFIALLGLALKLFDAEVLKAIPGLGSLFDSLINLANAIIKFSTDQLIQIGLSFLGIAAFIALLGLALKLFDAEVLKAIPGLGQLLDSIRNLAKTIAAFSTDQLIQIGLSFLGIAAFIALLGLALKLFDAEVLAAIPNLGLLFDSLVNLANAIAGFSTDQLIQIGLGFLSIVIFLGLLSFALNNFSVDVLNALPNLSLLLDSLMNLVITFAGLSPGQLLLVGLAFAGLTAFMFGLAAALDLATPGLLALAAVLARIESLLNSVVGAAARAVSSLGGLGSVGLGGISSLLPSFQEGGVMPETGLALLHAGERVLTVEENQALQGAGRGGMPLATPGAGGADQSVNIGTITITINAEKLEADAAQFLSDEIVSQIQAKIGRLSSEQDFRMGARPMAPA